MGCKRKALTVVDRHSHAACGNEGPRVTAVLCAQEHHLKAMLAVMARRSSSGVPKMQFGGGRERTEEREA